MSMEEEEYERCSVPNNHVTPVSRNWQSAKSRVSVESLQSIGPRRLEQSFGDTHKENQKISLESDMSAKLANCFQQDIFDNLGYISSIPAFGEMRDENSIRSAGSLQEQSMPVSESLEVEKGQSTLLQPKQPTLTQKITCKCPKSKCLLMYCECFSNSVVCNGQCSCVTCRNNDQFDDKRQKARRIVLERDPNAFMNRLEIIGGDTSELAYKRGCKCSKTNCFKKYCECYYANVKCTYLCECKNCMNGGINAYKG